MIDVCPPFGAAPSATMTIEKRRPARSRAAIVGARLDDRAKSHDLSFRLRFALTHMIQETARHCGHLDLMREVTDGRTGQ